MKKAYTPQCITALMWFAEREPVGWFDKTAPGHTMRSALERRGLTERLPTQNGKLVRYKVTAVGHAVLKAVQR